MRPIGGAWWPRGRQQVEYQLTNGTVVGSNADANNSFTASVAGSDPVLSTAACGAGSLKFDISLPTAMPQTLPALNYNDTITMVATPL